MNKHPSNKVFEICCRNGYPNFDINHILWIYNKLDKKQDGFTVQELISTLRCEMVEYFISLLYKYRGIFFEFNEGKLFLKIK